MKLCKDCKHIQYEKNIFGLKKGIHLSKCAHPDWLDPVCGKGWRLCDDARQYMTGTDVFCGRDGKSWEPKDA